MQCFSNFDFKDKVCVDDESSIIMTVVGFSLYMTGLQIQCSWFSNGVLQEAWFPEWRLSHKKREET